MQKVIVASTNPVKINIAKVGISNCSVTHIEINKDLVELNIFDSVEHLKVK